MRGCLILHVLKGLKRREGNDVPTVWLLLKSPEPPPVLPNLPKSFSHLFLNSPNTFAVCFILVHQPYSYGSSWGIVGEALDGRQGTLELSQKVPDHPDPVVGSLKTFRVEGCRGFT